MPSMPKTISDTDLELLRRRCHRTWIRSIITILGDTGIRVGELTSLRQDDLWISDSPVTTLDVRAEISKTGNPRSIPLTARTIDSIRDLRSALWLSAPGALSTWAFPASDPSKHLTARTIQRIIHKQGIRTLQIRVTPHTLRHTFATRLMRKTNIRVVQLLLGHRSLSSTQIYTHPNSQDLKAAIGTLEI